MKDERCEAILVDIDGVLCDVPYYMSYTPEEFKWKDFMEADLNREPINAGISLVQIVVHHGLTPVFLTARPECMREQTEQLLREYNLSQGELFMADDNTMNQVHRNYQLHQMVEKRRIIDTERLTERYHFIYAIDDQEYNAKMYNEIYGIPTLQARFI